jgi:hypothetical protein
MQSSCQGYLPGYLQWRDLKRFHLQAWLDRSAETPHPISNV